MLFEAPESTEIRYGGCGKLTHLGPRKGTSLNKTRQHCHSRGALCHRGHRYRGLAPGSRALRTALPLLGQQQQGRAELRGFCGRAGMPASLQMARKPDLVPGNEESPGGTLGPVMAPPGWAHGRTCRTRARTPPAVASCSLIFDKGKTHVCETGLRVCVPICPTGSPCRQSGISRPRRLRTWTCFLALSDGPRP